MPGKTASDHRHPTTGRAAKKKGQRKATPPRKGGQRAAGATEPPSQHLTPPNTGERDMRAEAAANPVMVDTPVQPGPPARRGGGSGGARHDTRTNERKQASATGSGERPAGSPAASDTGDGQQATATDDSPRKRRTWQPPTVPAKPRPPGSRKRKQQPAASPAAASTASTESAGKATPGNGKRTSRKRAGLVEGQGRAAGQPDAGAGPATDGEGEAPQAPPADEVPTTSVPTENSPETAKLRLQATLITKARDIIIRQCLAFIAGFVYIDDPDFAEPQKFDLWDGQKDALEIFLSGSKTIVLKARQLGLTWLALSYAVWRMISRRGYRVVALSRGEDEAKELVRRAKFILDQLPRWLVCKGLPDGEVIGYTSTTEAIYMTHPDGRISSFMSFPASQDAGRSFTASLVLIDEWAFQQYAHEIWTAAFPTINRPNSGQVIGLSTGARGTLFEEIWRDARAGDNFFVPIFLPWWTDPRRTPEWHRATVKAMPKTHRREYPANEEDAFSAGQGAAFQEWDDKVHIFGGEDWYPQGDHWRIYIAYDPGYSTHAAALWIALHPDGWAVAYREYYVSKVIDPVQAEDLRERSRQPDTIGGEPNPNAGKPERIRGFLIPTDAWLKKSDTGKCTADIFTEHGWPLTKATNDRIAGWRRMHEWLLPFEGEDGQKMAKLRFTRACKAAIRHFPAATSDKNDPEDVNYTEDHILDAARYFVASNVKPAPEKKVRRDKPKPVSSITAY